MKHLNYTSLIYILYMKVMLLFLLHFTLSPAVLPSFFGDSLLTTQQIHAKAVDTTLDIAE